MGDDSRLQRGLPESVAVRSGNHGQRPRRASQLDRIRETERLRAVPVVGLLDRIGATRNPKDPQYNWDYEGMRIVTAREDTQKWYDDNKAGAAHRFAEQTGVARWGGYGAVDLLMYVYDVDFREAKRRLGGNVSRVLPAAALAKPNASAQSVPAARTSPGAAVYALPVPHAPGLHQVRRYLTTTRAIPPDVVDAAIAQGRVFAARENGYQHAVFRLDEAAPAGVREGVGFALRGVANKPFHGVRGEKGLFYTSAPDVAAGTQVTDESGKALEAPKIAAFTESAIEALSYKALRGNVLAIAISGSAVEMPAREAARLVRLGYQLVAAYNADAKGDQLSSQLAASVNVPVTRDRPDARYGKDWNDELKALQQREASVVSRFL